MKVMDIRLCFSFLLVLFCLNAVSAININFEFPEEVYQNKEFNVNVLDIDVYGTFDVKIYITNGSGKIISDIYSEKWQSSNYYIKSAYPSQNSFRLIVTDDNGSGQICVKLRQSGKSSAIGEVCRSIEILKKEESLGSDYNEEDKKVESNLINNDEEIVKNNITNIVDNKIESINYDDKPIVLENKKSYYTSYFDNRLLLIYGFAVLCVIIIILLAIKRI